MYKVIYTRQNKQVPDETGAMPAPVSTREWSGPAKTAKRAIEKANDYWENVEGKPLDGYDLQPVVDLDD